MDSLFWVLSLATQQPFTDDELLISIHKNPFYQF